ncbi:MAG: lipopolysaccharide transport periplasmic protein LptA [Desulfuromonadales bacterium]|jgi:lipopolysaccharide export system protein LptA
MTRPSFFLFLLFLLAFATPSPATDSKADPTEPIDIVSDRLEADDAARQIRFLGHVVAKQGEVTLHAREMTVFLQAEGREIDRIEALGEVRILQGERVATGEKGIFSNRERKITLTGAPQVHQGKDVVTGDEIVVFLNEEKSIVKSGDGNRVRAIFHPKDKNASGGQP